MLFSLVVALPLAIRQAKMFWHVRGPRFLCAISSVAGLEQLPFFVTVGREQGRVDLIAVPSDDQVGKHFSQHRSDFERVPTASGGDPKSRPRGDRSGERMPVGCNGVETDDLALDNTRSVAPRRCDSAVDKSPRR